jgi:hypothetical protein
VAGNDISDRKLHPANAPSPILVTVLGIVTLFSLLQPEKIELLRLVNVLDIIIVSKFVQLANAEFPMLVTLFGIVIEVKMHLLNAKSPMLITLFGIFTVDKRIQPSNA